MLNKFIIIFVRILFCNICSSYTYLKIIKPNKLNKEQIIKAILLNVLMSFTYSILYPILRVKLNISIVEFSEYLLYTLMFSTIIDNINYSKRFNASFISIFFSVVSKITSGFVVYFSMRIIGLDATKETIIEYIMIGILQNCIIYLFFKIRRFKDGFSFFNSNDRVNGSYVYIIMSIIITLMVIIVGLNDGERIISTICVLGIVIGAILMLNWIRRKITEYYKKQMKDRMIECLQEESREKDKTIKLMSEELDKVLKINHKYNRRLLAMERAVSKLNFDTETAEEYADIVNAIKDLSSQYRQEVSTLESGNELQKTNIYSIDNLLEFFKEEALKSNIELNVEINADITYLLKTIAKKELETLIGDHISDAITAIKLGGMKNRKIMVVIGEADNFYELCFYDTGIDFEIDTLLKLGKEQVTTHKENGGSGIGFVTTFETLRKYKASLVIEEYEVENNDIRKHNNEGVYTKAVKIQFDGKTEYRINSYRAKKIKKQDKDNRIIIKELKLPVRNVSATKRKSRQRK